MTDEERKARKRERMRHHRANLSPERKQAEREAARARMAIRYASLTDEQRRERTARNNETRRRRREAARIEREKQRQELSVARRVENRRAINEDGTSIYQMIIKSIPRTIYADIRDDIANDIVIALYDGEIGTDEIKSSVTTYLRRHLRLRDWYGSISLDTPLPDFDTLTIGDTLATN